MPLIDRRTGEGLRVMASLYELLLPNLIFMYMYTHIHVHIHMYTHTCHIPNTDARSATCQLYALGTALYYHTRVRNHTTDSPGLSGVCIVFA